MSAFAEDKERRLIPRWRFADQLSFSLEFACGPRLYNVVTFDRRHLEEKLADWYYTPNLGTAIDLLSCGVGGGWRKEVRPAAEYLRKYESVLTPQAVALVRQTLVETIAVKQSPPHASDVSSIARARVAAARKKLHRDPRSALACLDFARGQAILGHLEQASLATQRALYLAPHHRHMLRAAARFYVHVGEPDRAHSLLVRNPRTPTDPWLMAAEISVAKIAQRRPRFVKAARQMIEARQLPREHLTELHSSLGTLEYYSGADRRARKFMRASLEAPNDNTVAQARWLRTKLSGLPTLGDVLELPLSFEARCWHSLETRRWHQAGQECADWLYDEPFSSRPAQLGSYIGVSVISDYTFAETSARIGLRADPTDTMLRNNLTVALAYQGKTEEAIGNFARIKLPPTTHFTFFVYLATTGLLHFRAGDISGGRRLYATAERCAPLDQKGNVAIFHAREELWAQTERAYGYVERAHKMDKKAKNDYSQRLLEMLKQQARDHPPCFSQNFSESDVISLQCQLAPIANSVNAIASSGVPIDW